MLELIGEWSWEFLIATVFLIALHFLAEPVRWYFYDKREIECALGCYINVFNLSAVLSYLLPAKLGLPSRYFLLSNFVKLDTSEIASRMMLDGVIYYGLWALAASLSLFFFQANIRLNENIKFFVIIVTVLLVALLLMLGWKSVRYFGKSAITINNPRVRVFQEIKHKFFEQPPRVLVIVVGIAFADMFFQGLRHIVLLEVVGQSFSISIIFPIVAIAIFCGLLSMMPMGLGGYDGTLVLLLGAVGVPLDSSLQVIMINRVMSISVAVLLGLLASRMLHAKLFNLRKEIGSLRFGFKRSN